MEIGKEALPFSFEGSSDVGILVIHGYTGTTSGVLPWAQGLAKAGYTVTGPRLTAHGTQWQDLNKVSWKDWCGDVEEAYQALRSRTKKVFVAGLSMGAALALYLAEKHGEIAGLLLVNNLLLTGNPLVPFLPLIRLLIPSVPALANDIKDKTKTEMAYSVNPTGGSDEWRKLINYIKPRLKTVTQPALLMKSREDHVIPVKSTLYTFEKINSQPKELVWLENSYHVATMDFDLPLIVDKSLEFIERILKK